MVGVGPYGLESALARVTLVNFVGDVVLDEFVLPQETVTDWRTAVSGIRKEDMANGEYRSCRYHPIRDSFSAKPFAEIQTRVAELLKDRYLVGHALKNDLDALLLSHPWLRTRDTQGFRVFKGDIRSASNTACPNSIRSNDTLPTSSFKEARQARVRYLNTAG